MLVSQVMRGLKKGIDRNLLFWIVMPLSILIMLKVPQVQRVWYQWPREAGWDIVLGYALFVGLGGLFYLASIFVVLRPYPLRPLREKLGSWFAESGDGDPTVSGRTPLWLGMARQVYGWFRRLGVVVEWLSLTCLVRRLEGRRTSRGVFGTGIALLAVGALTFLVWGASADDSHSYTLAGAFCKTAAVWLTAVGGWLLWVCWPRREEPKQRFIAASTAFGRILSWLVLPTCALELCWIIADRHVWNPVSYRLYTIWALMHLFTVIVLVALLVDRLHQLSPYPLRPLVVLLAGAAYFWVGDADSLTKKDLERDQIAIDPGANGATTVETMRAERREDEVSRWLGQFSTRIHQIPEDQGPVVLVAASGGGSRAAIFTALTLELLARSPLQPTRDLDYSRDESMVVQNALPKGLVRAAAREATPRPSGSGASSRSRTWADNIALISSVSGGSLATAWFAHRYPLGRWNQRRVELRNTTTLELRARSRSQVRGRVESLRSELVPDFGDTVSNPDDFELRDDAEFLKKLDEEWLFWTLQRTLLLPAEDSGSPDGVLSEADTFRLEKVENYLQALRAAAFLHEKTEARAYQPREAERYEWVMTSLFFDEMCTDFMAPLLRGLLTPAVLARGDALARFWTQVFGWQNCSNVEGFTDALHRPQGWPGPGEEWRRPLLMLNASKSRVGARLVIGLPPLPRTLPRDAERTMNPERSMETLGGQFPLSLSRAVRLSSNFPWGFRVNELEREDKARTLRVLDGGIADNTGLDSIHDLFQWLSDLAGADHEASGQASEIVAALRRRGVVLLEVDSGGKPSAAQPDFSALTEPIQALGNAGFVNAGRIRAMYARKILAVITGQTAASGESDGAREREDGEEMAPLAVHEVIQCNHYSSQEAAAADVMTAWALGPEDKAEIVVRFLIELGRWDQGRRDLIENYRKRQRAILENRLVQRLVRLDFSDEASMSEEARYLDSSAESESLEADREKLRSLAEELKKTQTVRKDVAELEQERKELVEGLNRSRRKVASNQELQRDLDVRQRARYELFEPRRDLAVKRKKGG